MSKTRLTDLDFKIMLKKKIKKKKKNHAVGRTAVTELPQQGLPQTFNHKNTAAGRAQWRGFVRGQKSRASREGDGGGCAGKTQRPVSRSHGMRDLLARQLARHSGLAGFLSPQGLAGLQGGDPSDRTLGHITCLGTRRARNARAPGPTCTLPPPTPHPAGFVGLAHLLGHASLHLFHKLEGFLESLAGRRGTGLRPASWGPKLCVCLPTCSLLSVGAPVASPESLPCDLQDCPVECHAGCLRSTGPRVRRPSWASADLRCPGPL